MVTIAPASNRGELTLQCLLLGALYFFGGVIIDLLAIGGGGSILVWPSAGIALSAVVLLGYRVWPGIVIGQLGLAIYHGADWQMVVLLIPGAVVQSIVGAQLILRRRGMHPEIRNVRDALWFIMVVVIACSLIGATMATVGKTFAGHFDNVGAAFSNLWKWALGDGLGIIVFYPFLMNWTPHVGARMDHQPMNRERWLAVGAVLIVSLIVYDSFGFFGQWVKAMAFLPLPILMWIALRYGMRMGTLNLILVVILIVWGASIDDFMVLQLSPAQRVLIVVGFAFMVAMATLMVAALAEEYDVSQSALRDSEALSRRILETTPNVTYVFDLIGQQNIYSNQKITDLLGYSPAEIQKMGDQFLTKLLHPDDIGKLPAMLSRWDTASDADLFSTEYRMKDAGGEWHWFEATDAVFKRDDKGKVIQIIGNARDITEMQRAREQAQLDSSFNESIVANAGEGICVCTEIPEFPFVKFSVWNEQMEVITGYSMAEINKLGWYQSMYPDPDVQERAIARMQRMRDGDNLAGDEWEITRKDGGKRQILITTSIVMSNDGVPNVLGVMSDITAKNESSAAIERLENLYRQAITAANAVPYMQDHTTNEFTFVGEGIEELTGYTSEEMNRTIWDQIAETSVLQGENAQLSLEQAVQAAREGKTTKWQCDTMIRSRSGERRWVSDFAVEIPGADGIPTGSIGILVDITPAESMRRKRCATARRGFGLSLITLQQSRL